MSSSYEIIPAERLAGTIQLPADKSISHRAAMFAALHQGTSRIENFSTAADPQSTLHCLRRLGVEVEEENGTMHIQGVGRDGWPDLAEAITLDCGNSGTTMRLLAGLLGGAGVRVCLTGDQSLSKRPMKRILDPLQQMHIAISGSADATAPLCIQPGYEVQAMNFKLPIPSAQLKSCVLLAGLFGSDVTTVMESIPSRDHTERMLALPIDRDDPGRVISAHRDIVIPNQSGRIPGDFSAAAFWLVGASVHPTAQITLKQVGLNPSRTGALDILQRMGADIQVQPMDSSGVEPLGNITVRSSDLRAVRIQPDEIPNCIDELPILAVAMAFAQGESVVEGAGELRVKETDRLRAIADMLSAAGVSFEMRDDGFTVQGNPEHRFAEAQFNSFGDHRIAMAAAILSLRSESLCQIKGADCVSISYPAFFEHLTQLTV
jgi:3-phosphoshikimate 1-carboxyvinyltransferase